MRSSKDFIASSTEPLGDKSEYEDSGTESEARMAFFFVVKDGRIWVREQAILQFCKNMKELSNIGR